MLALGWARSLAVFAPARSFLICLFIYICFHSDLKKIFETNCHHNVNQKLLKNLIIIIAIAMAYRIEIAISTV